MSDEYILPGEFIALLAFVFAPPIIIALALQSLLFYRHQVFRKPRIYAALSYLSTVFGSLVVTAVIYIVAPQSLSPILQVRFIDFSTWSFPISPAAFLAVAIAVLPITWWVITKAQTAAHTSANTH